MQGPYFTISNFFSVLRVVFIIPIIFFLYQNNPFSNVMAIVFSLLACVTDYLDGFFARRLNQVSDLGKILDPLADKLAIDLICFVLVMLRGFPVWLFAIILGRDLFIVLGGLFIIGRRKIILQSNLIGKLTVNFLAVTVILYMANLDFLKPWFIGLSLAGIILSGTSYLVTFIKKMRSKELQSVSDSSNLVA